MYLRNGFESGSRPLCISETDLSRDPDPYVSPKMSQGRMIKVSPVASMWYTFVFIFIQIIKLVRILSLNALKIATKIKIHQLLRKPGFP